MTQPAWIGTSNPLDEYEAECAGCGGTLDGEKFKDSSNDDICGDCAAYTFEDKLTGMQVAYVGNMTFKVCEAE
jgi:hypothetical protein